MTAPVLGYSPAALDATLADYVARLNAMNRARKYRRDYFDLAKICERWWSTAFRDAGTFGPEYCGIDHYEARDLAREAWRDSIWEMNRHVF